jgi:hypothetical protein
MMADHRAVLTSRAVTAAANQIVFTRGGPMTQIINQLVQFLQQGISAIFKFLQMVWTWSFGQIVAVFQSNWQSLPLWKLAVLALVVGGIAYVLYKAALEVWDGAEKVLKAFLGLLGVLISALPYVLIAGLIAFAGGWVIRTVNF